MKNAENGAMNAKQRRRVQHTGEEASARPEIRRKRSKLTQLSVDFPSSEPILANWPLFALVTGSTGWAARYTVGACETAWVRIRSWNLQIRRGGCSAHRDEFKEELVGYADGVV